MNRSSLNKTGLLSLAFSLFISYSFAQKSIYDVVPGSGPQDRKTTAPAKKKNSSLPGVINRSDRDKDDWDRHERRHHRKYKHLPPGQAKKIYGGSAKDYAPGQRKKYYKKYKHKRKHHRHDD